MDGPTTSPAPALALPAGVIAAREAMDEQSFQAFYDRTSRPLWSYLYKVARDRTLADDLLQEAYYRYVRSRFAGESDEHRKNYLYRIAANLLRDHFRQRRRATFVDEEPRGVTASGERQIETSRDLGRLLAVLKPRERQLLWLAHVEGFDHEEIGRELGVKAASVRLMVFRARRKLAALLAREGLGPEVTG